MIGFMIGFVVGAFFGITILCLCIAAKDDEDVR